MSGGTDTHLALIDLRGVGVTGKEAEARCDAARITLNKNAIPYDPQPPMTASGIRVGTPAVTTQGMTEGEMQEVAALIGRAVADPRQAAAEVAEARRRAGRRPTRAYPRPGASASGVREYLLVLLRRGGGDVPAHARWCGWRRPALGRRGRGRATATCTRSRPRGSAGSRCSSAWRGAAGRATQLPTLAGRLRHRLARPRALLVRRRASSACSASVDDRWELDALTKLAGQVLAAGVMVLQGVQLLMLSCRSAGGRLSFGPDERRR